MKHSFKNSLLFILVILALTVSAIGVTPAFADDSTPPPPATEEPVQPPTDEPVATQQPEVTETPAPADAPEAISTQEVLEQLPADTTLVVLDESGDTLPLASQDATEVLAAPDPYFTVSGVTFRFFATAGSCSAAGFVSNCFDGTTTPIQDAINYLASLNATPDDGKIYVESGTYNESVNVNGYNWASAPTTLGIIGAGSSTTTLNGYFNIYNMNAFSFSGFTVNGSVYAYGNNGTMELTDLVVTNPSGTGIYIDRHNGDVKLKNVDASNNHGEGANIYIQGNIDVTDSQFNSNGYTDSYTYSGYDYYYGYYTYTYDNGYGSGLNLNSNNGGNITLNNVSASENNQNGASIYTDGKAGIVDSQFNSNGSVSNYSESYSGGYYYGSYSYSGEYGSGSGLHLNGNAGITLNNISTNENLQDGANIYTNGTVDITDSQFDSNGYFSNRSYNDGSYSSYSEYGNGTGFNLNARNGNATLNNISVNDNYRDGAYIYSNGTVNVTDGQFNSNGSINKDSSGYGGVLSDNVYGSGTGITLSGSVTLNKITASENVLDGVMLNSSKGGPIGPVGGNTVTISCGTFEDNGGYGINSRQSGTLTLNGVIFNGNTAGETNLSNGGTLVTNTADCNTAPTSVSGTPSTSGGESADEAVKYYIIEQTQDQLPAALGQGNAFASALKVSFIDPETQASDFSVTLSFPIPDGMIDANLVVMFWDGSEWVAMTGGSVVNGQFVITVSTPGTYVLVGQ